MSSEIEVRLDLKVVVAVIVSVCTSVEQIRGTAVIWETGECYSRCSTLHPSAPPPSHPTPCRALVFQQQKKKKTAEREVFSCVSAKCACVCVNVWVLDAGGVSQCEV